MKTQKQEITDFKTGDCFRTCVASLLNLGREKVYNFMADGEELFTDAVTFFNRRNRLILIDVTVNDTQLINGVSCIAAGKSPRDESKLHCVVWKNGKCIMDPHPDGTGIIGEPEYYTLLVPKSPGILKSLCTKG